MTKTFLALVLAWGLVVAVTARAQTTPPPAVPAAPPAPSGEATAAPAAPAAPVEAPAPAAAVAAIPIGTRVGYVPTNYEDGNRRDPFASLIAARSRESAGHPAPAVPGLPGLTLADVTVRGIVKSGDNILAILEGPNQKSYVARLNDKLRDAKVQAIDAGGVDFAEQLGAGMRGTTVRKTIRPAGEGIQ